MDADAPEETKPEGRAPGWGDALRSLGVALLALAGTAGLVALLAEAFPPAGFDAIVALVVYAVLTPGLLIGLLATRRPLLTALTLCGVVLVADVVLFRAQALLPWAAACLVLLLGAALGRTARATRTRLIVCGALYLAGLIGFFVVPGMAHRQQARRFAERRLDDLVTTVSRDHVTVPRGLAWRRKLARGFWPTVELSTGWTTTTATAGPGDCRFDVRVGEMPLTGDLGDHVEGLHFTFQPRRTTGRLNDQQARTLLRELGLKLPPEGLTKRAFDWSTYWRTDRRHGPHADHHLTIARSGQVTLELFVPLVD